MLQVSIRCYYALKEARLLAAESSVMVSGF